MKHAAAYAAVATIGDSFGAVALGILVVTDQVKIEASKYFFVTSVSCRLLN
jgi:hypothetical protein